jgi:DNA-binding transcriptional MerR regulator
MAQEARKSPTAFRTIGEVATDLNLPQHVLRFWESKFPHIKPHKRRGGHRYYRPEDVDFLKEVKTLLHEKGFTIKGAQKYLGDKIKAGGEDQSDLFGKDDEAAARPPAGFSPEDLTKLKAAFNELCEIKDLLKKSA